MMEAMYPIRDFRASVMVVTRKRRLAPHSSICLVIGKRSPNIDYGCFVVARFAFGQSTDLSIAYFVRRWKHQATHLAESGLDTEPTVDRRVRCRNQMRTNQARSQLIPEPAV